MIRYRLENRQRMKYTCRIPHRESYRKKKVLRDSDNIVEAHIPA